MDIYLPAGCSDSDDHFDLPSVGDTDGYDEEDPLNIGYNDGWNDCVDKVVSMLYSTAAEVRKLRHNKDGEQK